MKKRIFAAALLIALAVTLCPAAMAADRLSTPTDLAWDWNHGLYTMTWDWGDNYTGLVRFAIYKDDHLLVQDELECGSVSGGGVDPSCFLAEHDLTLDSGVYQFTVQSITDFGSDSEDNSGVAVSPKWAYTAPEAQLAPPTGLSWDFPYHVWRRGSDVYEIQTAELLLYFCESEDGDYQMIPGSYSLCDLGRDAVRLPVDTWALEECGAGYYKFRVINLSDDLDQVQSSPWSEYSEPCYYDGSPVELCDHRNYIRSDDEKMPTCTEPGYSQDVVCADCGEVLFYAETLPALGHDPDADGVCQRCGERVEDRKGTLGEGSGALVWTYTAQTGTVAFKGVIPVGETVLVACYQDGRFTGMKTATSGSPTVTVDTAPDQLRLFWLDGGQIPQCPAVGFTLAQ